MRDELKEAITRDPLHKIQGEYARLCSFRQGHSLSSYINSGRLYEKLGRYKITPKYMDDSLMFALQECSKISCILMQYFLRQITGATLGSHDKPKQYIRTDINRKDLKKGLREDLAISSASNFYTAVERLREKKLIRIDEEDGRLFINFWPLTWNIQSEIFKEKISEIVYKEIDRIREKISKGETNGSE